MFPNTTQLSLFISTSTNAFEGVSAPALPLNVSTNVRVEAVGREVYILYNSSLVALSMMNGTRISGNAIALISNPWESPANAIISSISMTPISKFSSRSIADYSGPLARGIAYEKAYVPEDFALSFNITLNGKVSGSSSIIHYTQDNTNNGRIPGR